MCERKISPPSARVASMSAGVGVVHVIHDRAGRVEQESGRLRARHEEHAVVQAAPAVVDEVPGRPMMVGQEDRVDAGFLRFGEHLRARAAGVSRVFGVGMQDGP